MALTAGSNWGNYPSRFMSTLKGKAAIVPVHQDTLVFTAGGHDPYNGGANFEAEKFYLLGSSTGDKAYKPSYEVIEAKDEVEAVIKKKQILRDAMVELVFNQDPESFIEHNLAQRFLLLYRESERDDGMVKYRACPKVIFSQGEVTIPSGGAYATYSVSALVEENTVAKNVSYRELCDIYAQDLLVSENNGKELHWTPEFGSAFKLADIGAGGSPTYTSEADDAAISIAESRRTGTVTGKISIQEGL